MKIRKSLIVSAINEAEHALTFEQIEEAFSEQVDYINLHVALAEMVARERLKSFVDDGRVVYQINK